MSSNTFNTPAKKIKANMISFLGLLSDLGTEFNSKKIEYLNKKFPNGDYDDKEELIDTEIIELGVDAIESAEALFGTNYIADQLLLYTYDHWDKAHVYKLESAKLKSELDSDHDVHKHLSEIINNNEFMEKYIDTMLVNLPESAKANVKKVIVGKDENGDPLLSPEDTEDIWDFIESFIKKAIEHYIFDSKCKTRLDKEFIKKIKIDEHVEKWGVKI